MTSTTSTPKAKPAVYLQALVTRDTLAKLQRTENNLDRRLAHLGFARSFRRIRNDSAGILGGHLIARAEGLAR